jgi:hypothetical protein
VSTLVYLLSPPAFESVDAVDAGQVRGMTAFVINRPDGGPDVGHPSRPIDVRPDDYEKVLAPLRGATRIPLERGDPWLGRLTVKLADGRSQSILLYRSRPANPKQPPALRFKIGRLEYEAGTLDALVKALAESERGSKP